MNILDNLLYTKEHEWILIEGNKGKIGITYYAQSHLGDITYIELPQVGKEIKQFEVLASVESVKAASDVYAPMSGKVVQVNDNLESSPESINKSPYGDGWITVIEIEDESEKTKLMDSKAYKEYLKTLESRE
jgi:glycine cleavage system H protein